MKEWKINYGTNQIGMKKTLVFCSGGEPKGNMTIRVMHEYDLTLKELGGTNPGQVYRDTLC